MELLALRLKISTLKESDFTPQNKHCVYRMIFILQIFVFHPV